jgi:hypothetical protein
MRTKIKMGSIVPMHLRERPKKLPRKLNTLGGRELPRLGGGEIGQSFQTAPAVIDFPIVDPEMWIVDARRE